MMRGQQQITLRTGRVRPRATRGRLAVPSRPTRGHLFRLDVPGTYEVSHDRPITVVPLSDTDAAVVVDQQRELYRISAAAPIAITVLADNAVLVRMR
jgi:hypothetical protein